MDVRHDPTLIRNSKFSSDYSFRKFLSEVESYTKRVITEKQPFTLNKTYDEVYSYVYGSFKMKWNYENDSIDI